jgi:RND family efflux transporter MFP subunit
MKALEETANAAEADADAAEAEHRQLEVNLDYMTVTAPIAGVIVAKPEEVGELVGPTTTAPVAEIEDFSTLLVETDVPETRLGLIQKGGPAEVVVELSPRVNRVKATVVVKVRFADPVEGVLPEMSARVSFLDKVLDENAVKEPPRLFVPGSAVVERDGEKVVFRLDEGKARMEKVTLGPAMGAGFELVKGPPEGTKVIASPPSSIADGYPVKERNKDE